MKFIPEGLTQKIGREILTMKKNSPKMLFVVGVVGAVGSTILACRATLKLSDTLDEFKEDVDAVKTELVHHDSGRGRYPVAEYKRDLAYAYMRGSLSIAKLYAPAVIIGGVSLAALTTSHVTLTRRNAGLTAAYSALQTSYNAYRDRVREELGEDKERDIYHGAEIEKVKIDGKTKEIRRFDPNKLSMYSKIFDETNRNWVRNSEQNRVYVQTQQNYANHLLHARGHVFLNEIYDNLGFPHTSAGALVGWVMNQGGDNYIDFGLLNPNSSQFVNGWEQSIVLDFNVDGPIYNLI